MEVKYDENGKIIARVWKKGDPDWMGGRGNIIALLCLLIVITLAIGTTIGLAGCSKYQRQKELVKLPRPVLITEVVRSWRIVPARYEISPSMNPRHYDVVDPTKPKVPARFFIQTELLVDGISCYDRVMLYICPPRTDFSSRFKEQEMNADGTEMYPVGSIYKQHYLTEVWVPQNK